MKSLIKRLRLRWRRRSAEGALAKSEGAHRALIGAGMRLQRSEEELTRLQTHVEVAMAHANDAITEARRRQEQAEESMEHLRQENRVLRETTIPALVAQHRLVLERTDADVASQVRRRTLNGPNREE